MKWDLHVAGPARRALERLEPRARQRILATLETMRDDPFGGDIARLKNQAATFRRRVGPWRIFFDVEASRRVVVVVSIVRRTSTTY